MKKKTWFFPALVFILFVLLIMHAADAVAEWRIEYSDHLIKAMRDAGYTVQKYHGSYCTKQECEEALRRASTGGFNISGKEAWCSGYDCPSKGSGGGIPLGGLGSYGSPEDFARGMAMGLVGSLISAALAPQPQVDYAYQKWLEEEARRKREEARKKRQQVWKQLSARQREKDNRQFISMFDVAGSNDSPDMESTEGDGLDGFDWYVPEIPENELQPRGTGKYDTSRLSFLQRLSCANGFSQRAIDAANNGDHVNARYLNEQAQKVISGQMTDLECQYTDLPDIPEVPTPQPVLSQKEIAHYESMIKSVQQDISKLQDIKIKLKETDEKIKQAEEKKQQAEQEITEIQNRAASADKPEEKQECDDLLAQARQLEQEAQQQIQAAIDDKQNYLNEEENITNKLKEVQKSMEQTSGSD